MLTWAIVHLQKSYKLKSQDILILLSVSMFFDTTIFLTLSYLWLVFK